MATDVLMPVLTEPGEDGVVTAWMVDEGETCRQGQLIAEIQVEKVSDEVFAPESGLVTDRVGINEPVPQGQPICRIEAASERATAPSQAEPAADIRPEKTAETRVAASPSARRLAKELGVDLNSLSPSRGARITEADVRAAAGSGPARSEPALTGLRAVIARNMRKSQTESAAVTLTTTLPLPSGKPDHITAKVVSAAAKALAEHPDLNGTRDGDLFTPADTPHISVAIQTEQGLVSPVVRDPAAKSVEALHEEIADLAEKARQQKLDMSDYEGGTFTVTNLGAHGIDAFTPIINFPQVAILGVGAVREVPVFAEDGSLVKGAQMTLSLTFDHAFVDGAPAAEFLRRVADEIGG
jgi:pyruvate dehydrogenase E2 component (dihydrolipoamide acetyltransferase)